jgi:CDP-4-dehydro-6-deoxyglucose reductase, E3
VMPTPEAFEAEILSSEALAPRVRSFRLARTDRRALVFEPGQWLNLVLAVGGGEIRRAYSIASPPDGTPHFELAVTEVPGGPGSSHLFGLTAGATVQAIGPQGFFTRSPRDPLPALLVGTGTGVTPLRSMLLSAVDAGSRAPLWLLLGARHEQDLLYRRELELLMKEHPNVRLFFTLSRPPGDWSGLEGYVQAHIPALWAELTALGCGAPHLFVCGLEEMVSVVRDLARKTMRIARERVHSERYD